MPGTDIVATGLLTYAVHSVATCAIALAGARFIRRPQDRDVVWKAALVAPLATAAVAITLSVAGVRSPFVDLAHLARHMSPAQLPGRKVRIIVLRQDGRSTVDRWFSDPVTSALSTSAVAIAALLMGIAVTRLVIRRRRLALAIAHRHRLGEVTLANGSTARLSASTEIQTPVAFSRAEICLPDDVVREFSAPHQRSLIAHEMAHLERRDPAWFLAMEIIAAVSAFQPLVTTVARAFRRDVELICDETAVRRTKDQHSLINALALLATPFDPRSPLHGAPTAYDGSPLVDRAERIAALETTIGSAQVGRPVFLVVAIGLAALCALPVVSAAPRLTDIFPLDPGGAAANPHLKGMLQVDERIVARGLRRTAIVFH